MSTVDLAADLPVERPATKAWRPLLRLGARTARRNLWRSLLVVALIAVPVAGAIVVAAGQRTVSPSDEQQRSWYYGEAQWSIESYGPGSFGTPLDDEALQRIIVDHGLDGASIADVERFLAWQGTTGVDELGALVADAFGTDDLQSAWSGGYRLGDDYVEVSSLDAAAPIADGIYTLTAGRYAADATEATLSEPLANRLGVGIGDEIDVPGGAPATVTGLYLRTNDDGQLSLLTPDRAAVPGSSTRILVGGDIGDGYAAAARLDALIDEEAGAGAAQGAGMVGGLQSTSVGDQFGYDDAAPLRLDRPPVLSGVVATLLLVEVALIAAAAFSSGARRRLREFGLLATIGAEPAHVRRLVLAEAMVLGVAGSVVGVVGGIVGTRLATGVIRNISSYPVTTVNARVSEIIAPAMVGVLAAIAAAWIPARTASRVAPLTALTGRMPARAVKHRVVPLALALAGIGLLMSGTAAERSRRSYEVSDGQVLIIVFGALLCLAGSALLASWVLDRLAARAGRAPLSVRLVARDAGRQRFRSSVTVAGLVVVMAVPVIVASVALTEHAKDQKWNLAAALDDEIVLTDYSAPTNGDTALTDEVARVSTLVEGQDVGSIELLGSMLDDGYGVSAYGVIDGYGLAIGLGTDEAVTALRLPPAAADALHAGEAVALDPSITSVMYYPSVVPPELSDGDVEAIEMATTPIDGRPLTWSVPGVLVPPSMADDLGLVAVQTQTIVVAPASLTGEQVDDIRLGAQTGAPTDRLTTYDPESNSGTISFAVDDPRSNAISVLQVQLIALAIAMTLVLIIGGCLVAVAATESDHDLATMVRVGAAPSLRRRFLGLQAGYHALLGGLLGVPGGLLLLAELRRAVDDGQHLRLPWLSIGAVLVAMPLVLAVVVSTLVRSRPPRPSLQLT